MGQSLYWVFADGPEGHYEAFENWYHDTHMIEVVRHPKMVRAVEYRVTSSGPLEFPRHLGLYHMATDEPMRVVEDLRKGPYTQSGIPPVPPRVPPRLFTTVVHTDGDTRAALDELLGRDGFELLVAPGEAQDTPPGAATQEITWCSEGLALAAVETRASGQAEPPPDPRFTVRLTLTRTCERPGPLLS
jgi:hypothetical protein